MGTDLSGPGLDGRLSGLLRAAADKCRRHGRPVLASLTEPIPLAEPIALFHNAARKSTDRLLWMQPDCGFSLIGLGTAHVIEKGGQHRFSETATAWDTLCSGAMIAPAPSATPSGPIMMGGFSFDSGQPESIAWKGFPEARMVLPRACVIGADGRSWLTLNAVLRPGVGPEEEALAMARMRHAVLAGQSPPANTYRVHPRLAHCRCSPRSAPSPDGAARSRPPPRRPAEATSEKSFWPAPSGCRPPSHLVPRRPYGGSLRAIRPVWFSHSRLVRTAFWAPPRSGC